MRNLLWLGALAALLTYACSCNPSSSQEMSGSADTISYRQFISGFDSLQLPYTVPDTQAVANSSLLNKAYIEAFLAGKELMPVYEEARDVPAIEENMEVFDYYYDKIFSTNHSHGLIVEKRDGPSSYYYLFTFTHQGQYLSGLCLAFSEGSHEEKTERRADIKEDLSIQIRQSEFIKGEAVPGGVTEFFEINADGELVKLNQTEKPL